jgi:hypothetical protein
MSKFSIIAAKPVALLVLTCLSAVPAQASPPIEVFSHNASSGNGLKPLQSSAALRHEAETPKIGAGALAMMSGDKPIVHWFEAASPQPPYESRIIPRARVYNHRRQNL